eukprot:4917253-Prymnesium_polylepis.1
MGGSELANSALWEEALANASNVEVRQRVLRGFFCMTIGKHDRNNSRYETFALRRKKLSFTSGNGITCSEEVDDDGNLLWAQDHDDNASTPLVCAGLNQSHSSPYDAFGYDAVFAIAHALHDLLE